MLKSNKVTFFNCHTHVFTIDHVPKYVGKKMIPSLLVSHPPFFLVEQ